MGTKHNDAVNQTNDTGETSTEMPQFLDEWEEWVEPPSSPPNVSAYDKALSHVVAAEMQKDLNVRAFRITYLSELSEGKLAWDSMESWLVRQQQNAGKPTRFAEVALPERDPADTTPIAVTVSPEELGRARPRDVTYIVPPDKRTAQDHARGGTRSIAVSGAALTALYRVSADIPYRIPWSEGQTTTFILTRRIPIIRQVRIGAGILNPDWPALSRLELLIDPRITQSELGAAYQEERSRGVATARHHRDLSAKGLALAIFGTSPEGQEGMLAQRMARWNATHPVWAYHRIDNFSRDLGRARRRLLGISWSTRATDGRIRTEHVDSPNDDEE